MPVYELKMPIDVAAPSTAKNDDNNFSVEIPIRNKYFIDKPSKTDVLK